MDISGTRVMTALAGVVVAAALGVGIAAGQSGDAGAPAPIDLDPTCVLGVTSQDVAPDAPAWALGLAARSEEMNRQNRLGRYAPDGECADIPDWFRALVLRGDAMNRAGRLGPYAR